MWQWRSPRTSASSTSEGARHGTAPRAARAGTTRRRARRRRSPRRDRPGAARALRRRRRRRSRGRARPEAGLVGDEQLDRESLHGDADRAPALALDDCDHGRQTLERADGIGRPLGRDDDREIERRSAQRRGSPAGSPPSADAISSTSARARFRTSPRIGAGRGCSSRAEKGPLGLRADPGHLAEPACASRVAQLVRGADAEHTRELGHPRRAHPDEAAEAHELRLHLALELLELGDPSGLDQLLQACCDSRSDTTQLLNPLSADELVDRRPRLADRLRRATVRTGRVTPRVGEVEEHGEGLQPLGDRRIVHVLVHKAGTGSRRFQPAHSQHRGIPGSHVTAVVHAFLPGRARRLAGYCRRDR